MHTVSVNQAALLDNITPSHIDRLANKNRVN